MGGFKTYGPTVDTILNPCWEMTLSCWFKLDSLPALAQFMTKWGGTKANLYQLYYYNLDKRIALNLHNTSGYGQDLKVTGVTLDSNAWYHVAALVKSDLPPGQDNAWIYLTEEGSDAVELLGSFEWAPSDGAGGENRAMNYNNNGWFHLCNGESGYGFAGLVDEARYYSRCLSLEDLQELYDYVPPKTCADAIRKGYGLTSDFSSNCHVDFVDFATVAESWLDDMDVADLAGFADQWLQCVHPDDSSCVHPWHD